MTDKLREAVLAEERALDEKITVEVCGKTVTRRELSAAFDRVRDAKHWKNPIDKVISVADDFDRAVIAEAIVFYTGSIAEFEPYPGGRYRVMADGYFLTIGG